MSPGSSTESYTAFARIGLRENPGKNLNQVIQSLQHQSALQTIDELIAAIGTAFSQLTRDKFNNVFLTLQSHLIEIMKVNDGNNNKIPHMQKGHLDHLNILPSRLECPRNIYDEATVALQQ
ncbi:hypothetical protein ANN_09465 [Periplaneta americana]|uniref:Uncharacterized protein n=1 Tax=Periplaneta americana TaxID=6978 RepID=A0ABQ8TME0_PERAM|nr:hypothetical protein ANN_09465 [Periplaneta americana]